MGIQWIKESYTELLVGIRYFTKQMEKKNIRKGEGGDFSGSPTPPPPCSSPSSPCSKPSPPLPGPALKRERGQAANVRPTTRLRPAGLRRSSRRQQGSRRANAISSTTGPATIGGGWAPLRRLDGRWWPQRRPEEEERSGSSSSPNPKP